MPAARRPAAPSGVPRPAGERGAGERSTGQHGAGQRGTGQHGAGQPGAADRAEQRRVVRPGRAPAPRAPQPPAQRSSQPPTPRPATPSVPRPAAPRVRSTPSVTPRPASSRPTSRPDSGGRGSGGGRGSHGPAEQVQQRVPRLFTVRAMVMLIVLSIAFVLVFPTLRQYLDQKVQLDQLQAQVDAAESQNEELQAEVDRWADPAYVEAQARARLAFVMPGERALRVADPEVVPDTTTAEEPTSGPAIAADPSRPWYAQIWDSVQVAGSAGTGTSSEQDPATPGDNGTAPAQDGSVAPTP